MLVRPLGCALAGVLAIAPASAFADDAVVAGPTLELRANQWNNLSWIDDGGRAAPAKLVGIRVPSGSVTAAGPAIGFAIGTGSAGHFGFGVRGDAALLFGRTPSGTLTADDEPIQVSRANLYVFETSLHYVAEYSFGETTLPTPADSTASWKVPDWRIGLGVGLGFAGALAEAQFVYPDGSSSHGTYNARSFLFDVEAHACRRLVAVVPPDSGQRWICVGFRPNLFEFGAFSGGSLALRLEL